MRIKAKNLIIQILSGAVVLSFILMVALIWRYERDVSDGDMIKRAIWEMQNKGFTKEEIIMIMNLEMQRYKEKGLDYKKY